MASTYLEVTPAYGRDYKSQAEVKKAYAEGQDFHSPMEGYVNKQDAERDGIKLMIRYAKLQKVIVL